MHTDLMWTSLILFRIKKKWARSQTLQGSDHTLMSKVSPKSQNYRNEDPSQIINTHFIPALIQSWTLVSLVTLS